MIPKKFHTLAAKSQLKHHQPQTKNPESTSCFSAHKPSRLDKDQGNWFDSRVRHSRPNNDRNQAVNLSDTANALLDKSELHTLKEAKNFTVMDVDHKQVAAKAHLLGRLIRGSKKIKKIVVDPRSFNKTSHLALLSKPSLPFIQVNLGLERLNNEVFDHILPIAASPALRDKLIIHLNLDELKNINQLAALNNLFQQDQYLPVLSQITKINISHKGHDSTNEISEEEANFIDAKLELLTDLGDSLPRLTQLTIIFDDDYTSDEDFGSYLNNDRIQQISLALDQYPLLKDLTLNFSNSLAINNDEFAGLMTSVSQLTNLQKLQLNFTANPGITDGHQITNAKLISLASALEPLVHLEQFKLELGFDFPTAFGDDNLNVGLAALANALETKPLSAFFIDVSQRIDGLSLKGLKSILKIIHKSLPTLKKFGLKLAGCSFIGEQIDALREIRKIFINGNGKPLRSFDLDLADCEISGASLVTLTDRFYRFAKLESINFNFEHNIIRQPEANLIGQSLVELKQRGVKLYYANRKIDKQIGLESDSENLNQQVIAPISYLT